MESPRGKILQAPASGHGWNPAAPPVPSPPLPRLPPDASAPPVLFTPPVELVNPPAPGAPPERSGPAPPVGAPPEFVAAPPPVPPVAVSPPVPSVPPEELVPPELFGCSPVSAPEQDVCPAIIRERNDATRSLLPLVRHRVLWGEVTSALGGVGGILGMEICVIVKSAEDFPGEFTGSAALVPWLKSPSGGERDQVSATSREVLESGGGATNGTSSPDPDRIGKGFPPRLGLSNLGGTRWSQGRCLC